MSFQESTFKGDDEYNIEATGDCVIGDRVCFERATFSGSYRRPVFSGVERVKGTIVRDSYGADKQQHTFTLRLDDGRETLIKGRNLYKNGVWRKPWDDPAERGKAQDEKHARGDAARKARDERIIGGEYGYGR